MLHDAVWGISYPLFNFQIEAVIEFKGEIVGEFAIAEEMTEQLGRVVEYKDYVTREFRNRPLKAWLAFRGRAGDEQAEWAVSEYSTMEKASIL